MKMDSNENHHLKLFLQALFVTASLALVYSSDPAQKMLFRYQERGMCLPTSTDAATASSYRLVAPYTAGITSPADCVRDCHYVDGCSAINWYPETSSCELLQLPTSYSFYSKAVWQKGCFFAYRVCNPNWQLSTYATANSGVSRYLIPNPPRNSTFRECRQQCLNMHSMTFYAASSIKIQELQILMAKYYSTSYSGVNVWLNLNITNSSVGNQTSQTLTIADDPFITAALPVSARCTTSSCCGKVPLVSTFYSSVSPATDSELNACICECTEFH